MLTILVAISQFFTAAVVDLFIFRLKHDLGQGDTGTGATFAVASAAAVLAALSTPRLRASVSFHRLWLAAVALQGVVLLCMVATIVMVSQWSYGVNHTIVNANAGAAVTAARAACRSVGDRHVRFAFSGRSKRSRNGARCPSASASAG